MASSPGLGLLWGSSTASNLADGLFQVALPLLAVELTRSPSLVAAVTFSLTLPVVFVAALLLGIAEVFADTAAQAILPAIVPGQRLEGANARLLGAQTVANGLLVHHSAAPWPASRPRSRWAPAALLGRVTSAFRLFSFGAGTVGSVFAGLTAQAAGLRAVFAIAALLSILLLMPFFAVVTDQELATSGR